MLGVNLHAYFIVVPSKAFMHFLRIKKMDSIKAMLKHIVRQNLINFSYILLLSILFQSYVKACSVFNSCKYNRTTIFQVHLSHTLRPITTFLLKKVQLIILFTHIMIILVYVRQIMFYVSRMVQGSIKVGLVPYDYNYVLIGNC